ncbi:hypothetical protein GIB67_012996 [Kingdonia uniflora]|uniref:Chloride conductance regulatory protein ICln n=1 Tax=Kingdonia uniflora TaxID=39325 RepID=A0A7J7MCE9_9MAGN|nr:hypothetical protein GIB67_012996 [Kingdonia uniflora]
MVLGLRNFSERTGDGVGEPVLDTVNGEELMHVQPGVAIVLGNGAPESPGTLFISTKRVMWLSDVEKERGYVVDFLSVSLHAVSTDPEAYSSPCIYAQIETEAVRDDESEASDSENNETLDVSKITEMRLVPSDASQLDALFNVFCECAELNPEPVEEQEEEHNWIFSADQMVDEGGLPVKYGQSLIQSTFPVRGDSEWHFSESLGNPIGYSNGDHELSRSVIEVCLLLYLLCI